jgi:hypothetical protein
MDVSDGLLGFSPVIDDVNNRNNKSCRRHTTRMSNCTRMFHLSFTEKMEVDSLTSYDATLGVGWGQGKKS